MLPLPAAHINAVSGISCPGGLDELHVQVFGAHQTKSQMTARQKQKGYCDSCQNCFQCFLILKGASLYFA